MLSENHRIFNRNGESKTGLAAIGIYTNNFTFVIEQWAAAVTRINYGVHLKYFSECTKRSSGCIGNDSSGQSSFLTKRSTKSITCLTGNNLIGIANFNWFQFFNRLYFQKSNIRIKRKTDNFGLILFIVAHNYCDSTGCILWIFRVHHRDHVTVGHDVSVFSQNKSTAAGSFMLDGNN